jgi:ribosomal protein L32E
MNRHKGISLKQNKKNKKKEYEDEERKRMSRRRVKWRNERGNEGNNQLRVKEKGCRKEESKLFAINF